MERDGALDLDAFDDKHAPVKQQGLADYCGHCRETWPCDARKLSAGLREERAESQRWFEEYNDLRDAGDPSWDMFDATVNAAVHPYEELRIALSNFMDKPWANNGDWWPPVQAAFLALSPDWAVVEQEESHFEDPYLLGKHHGHLEERAGVWTEQELIEIREKARVRAAELRELAE